MWLSAWLTSQFGSGVALFASMFSAIAEVHASAASLGQLLQDNAISLSMAHWGFFGILAVSALAKSAIAWASGGRAYGMWVSIGLALMLAGVLAAVLLSGLINK